MQIRAKIVRRTGALHRRDNLAPDNKRADIGASRFLDEFLHQNVHIGAAERFDHGLCARHCFRQNNADALCPFQQLDYDRRAVDRLDDLFSLLGVICIGRKRQAQSMLGKDLHTTQLVAAATDRDAFVQRPAAAHLELAQD